MNTSTITWHAPDNLPDAKTNVLIGLNVDGTRTSCEGFLSTDSDDRPCWYDVTAEVIDPAHITGWAELPEGPAA